MSNQEQYKEDDRVQEVMDLLGRGLTRDQIAARFQIARSGLDQYMRRKHYVWKQQYNTYVMTPEHPQYEEPTEVTELPSGPKVRKVLSEFSKPGMHAKEVARRVGFTDVREMAQYMEKRGYVWLPEALTYVRLKPRRGDDEDVFDVQQVSATEEPFPAFSAEGSAPAGPMVDWGRYLPLLQMLDEHKGKLMQIIDQTPSDAIEIPRYTLPGASRPRSIQMVDRLKDLLDNFSRERNVRQREVLEVALIEFFRKYNYGAEVDAFLMTN